MTLEDGTDRFFRNFVNYQYTLRNIPEERGTYPYRGGSLKLAGWKVFTARHEKSLSIKKSCFVLKVLISVLRACTVLFVNAWGVHFNRSETQGFKF